MKAQAALTEKVCQCWKCGHIEKSETRAGQRCPRCGRAILVEVKDEVKV